MSKQATKNSITLKGSAQIVTEFLGYSLNTILFQRGIYDPDKFSFVKKYGMRLQVTTDEGLQDYLKTVLSQLGGWLEQGVVKKLVLVITGIDTEEVLERWVFDVHTEGQLLLPGEMRSKPDQEIQKEIAAILRQIIASVSFLPLLDCPCTFDLLVYTDHTLVVPKLWEESDPKYITKSNQVRLRSFTTSIHRMETSVAYRADDSA